VSGKAESEQDMVIDDNRQVYLSNKDCEMICTYCLFKMDGGTRWAG
jgi:hypothetical protein